MIDELQEYIYIYIYKQRERNKRRYVNSIISLVLSGLRESKSATKRGGVIVQLRRQDQVEL